MIQSKGILEFNPINHTKKHNVQTWKKVAMIRTYDDLSDYYSWFLYKRFNLKLNPPLRGSHITIISDKIEDDIFQEARDLFHGKEVKFSYNPSNLRSNGKHWWINIDSQESKDIRRAMGLEEIPYFGFHLTIGLSNEKNIDHSNYILNQIIKFNL